MRRRYPARTVERHERERLFILRFNAMHEVCGMPWEDCAAVYEAETGRRISPDGLRCRVARAKKDAGFVRVSEFPEKIVVSVYELTLAGCAWCAVRKAWSRAAAWLGGVADRLFRRFRWSR